MAIGGGKSTWRGWQFECWRHSVSR